MSGLADALQVSEHASWSTLYYGRIIDAALKAVGITPAAASSMCCICKLMTACIGGPELLVRVACTRISLAPPLALCLQQMKNRDRVWRRKASK